MSESSEALDMYELILEGMTQDEWVEAVMKSYFGGAGSASRIHNMHHLGIIMTIGMSLRDEGKDASRENVREAVIGYFEDNARPRVGDEEITTLTGDRNANFTETDELPQSVADVLQAQMVEVLGFEVPSSDQLGPLDKTMPDDKLTFQAGLVLDRVEFDPYGYGLATAMKGGYERVFIEAVLENCKEEPWYNDFLSGVDAGESLKKSAD